MSARFPALDNDDANALSVAVVGMAGRFPGAEDVDQLWSNLCAGVESIVRFSEADLARAGASQELLSHPGFVPAGAPLANVDCFDAAFFGIPPREAEMMDPQHRVFLECAWHALEHAGYDPLACPGMVGIYAGAALSTYLLCNLYRGESLFGADGLQLMLGNDKDFMVTRTSYRLGLRGPSCGIQTACSTSLVAVHMACQALLGGEADMALAGGASILLPQGLGYIHQEGSILAPDGHCRAFDAEARGTVVGNGIGLVVLKRLVDAVADGDAIHAVIKGSAINNDGGAKVSFTAPRVEGQADVIRAAHLAAGVLPASIGYVEAHGTGTPMGDPIEVAALMQAFGPQREGSCGLGSIKTNIGHLNTAAGVAGLIKAVLAVEHGLLPPSLHFKHNNPAIDFARGPFYVNERLREWPSGPSPRRAGVSSFGIGGTNAHVVLEEAQVRPQPTSPEGVQLLVLSARSEAALEQATDRLATHLAQHSELSLPQVACTLAQGRHPFAVRRAVLCTGVEQAAAVLASRDSRSVFSGVVDGQPRLVFMFPGQGAQYVGMARAAYGVDPAVTEALDRCAELLRPMLDLDLRELLFSPSANEQRLAETSITQPALFSVQYALAQSWQRFGLAPDAMIGHSVGEYAAACVAGVLSLPDALSLVSWRGRLMAAQPSGAMLSVAAEASVIAAKLREGVDVAADNAPRACVVSGTIAGIEAAERNLVSRGIHCRRLRVSHAFHSAMMDPLANDFIAAVRRVELRPPKIPYISSLTGTWVTDEQAIDAAYWFEQLRRPVRFSAGLRTLLSESRPTLPTLLEVGPGRSLGSLVRQHAEARSSLVLASLGAAHEEVPDAELVRRTLGQLFVAGHSLDWTALYPPEARQRVALPGYPFERHRYWVEAAPRAFSAAPGGPSEARQSEAQVVEGPVRKQHPRPAGAAGYAAPRDDRERELCDIWKELLGIEHIGIHDDFFEFGGQSLLVSELCTRLAARFGTSVPVRFVFEAPTIARLAARLREGGASSSVEYVTLVADAELDPAIEIGRCRPPTAEVSSVLVTGATGFLGAFLVEELARRTTAKIVCLVRGADCTEARARLVDHLRALRISLTAFESRLEVVQGDLEAPLLGLPPAEFERLAERVDAIYHAGAWVNFTYPYEALRAANVEGTRELIRLACAARVKPMHFISTAALFSTPDYAPQGQISEDAPVRYTAGLRGYEQSKWVAEQLVIAARARGVPTTIFRPATVTGHTRTGATNVRDLSLRMLLGCIELGAWPRFEMSFSMAPVEYVAGAIVHLANKPESVGKAFHTTSPRATTLTELVELVAAIGYPMPIIPYQDWRSRLLAAVQTQPKHPLAPFVPLFTEQHTELSLRVECGNVVAGLAGSDLVCPPLTAAALSRALSYQAETAGAHPLEQRVFRQTNFSESRA